MINVTAPKGHGFEFLPHGQKFAKPVEVLVPFDPQLIPEGMTADDVHTFYFDPVAQRWKRLERRSIDLGERVTRSTTDHFTIMIDAVLAIPKNPTPLSFDPTTISGIAAASPAANIDLIEPPSPNSTGDARLSLPIRIPRGRGAYSPSLSISYTSGGGNGWLGVGWDLALSKIEIDTRWGVPDYAGTGPAYTHASQARYLLDGAELVPTLDADGPRCADGSSGRRYHTRIEGAFAHILRCGAGVADFHFEVRDRDGTLFVYGNQTSGDAGIFRWQLSRVTDVHGNTTRFVYQLDDDLGTFPSPHEPSRELYLHRVDYTTHPSLPTAPYSIELERDPPLPCEADQPAGGRCDTIVSGRAGFKMVTRHLLHSIRVKHLGETVRQYVLKYDHGQFGKTLLASVRVYGIAGCNAGSSAFAPPTCGNAGLFHEHRFDYFRETEAFDAAEQWALVSDPEPATGALNKGNSTTYSLSLSAISGGQQDPTRATASIGGHLTNRAERQGTYDFDGDGLPDQLIETLDDQLNTQIAVLYNRAPSHQLRIGDPTLLTELGRERATGFNASIGGQVGFSGGSANAGVGFSNATTRSQRFLTDLDGDGFLDIVRSGGRSSFGRPCMPADRSICFSDQAFGATAAIDPAQDPLLQSYETEIGDRAFPGQAVLRWVAPFSGEVQVDATVSKLEAAGTKVVTVGLHHQDTLLDGVSFGPHASNQETLHPVVPIRVDTGESIYLVVSFADDPSPTNGTLADEIESQLLVRYTSQCADGTFLCSELGALAEAAHDPTGAQVFVFDSMRDFRVAGTPTPFVAPFQGAIALHGELSKLPTTAHIRGCVQKYPASTPRHLLDRLCSQDDVRFGDIIHLPADQRSVEPLELEIPVLAGEAVVLRVESDYSFDPDDILLVPSFARPLIEYVEACLPDDNGGLACTRDQAELVDLPVDISSFWVYPVLQTPPIAGAPTPFVAPRAGTLHVGPIDALGELAIRSDVQGLIAIIECSPSTCNPPPGVSSPIPDVETEIGESITFEFREASPQSRTIEVQYEPTEPLTATLISRALHPLPHPPSPFSGGYRQWHATLWNTNETFAPTQLLEDFQDTSELSEARLVQMASSAIAPYPAQLGTEFTGYAPVWIGPGSRAFVGGTRMNAGRLGLSFGNLLGNTDLFADDYVRLSGTRSFFVDAGVKVVLGSVLGLGFDLAVTASQTNTTTDVMDLNGDGIADVLAGDRSVFGALGEFPVLNQFDAFLFGDGFRRRSAHDYSIKFGGDAVFRQTTSSGRTVTETSRSSPETDGIIFKHGIGLAIGRSQTTHDLVDVNGDGLPDKVRRSGSAISVQYNLGDHFGVEEPLGTVEGPLADSIDSFAAFERSIPTLVGDLDSTRDALQHDTTITQHGLNSADFGVASASVTRRKTSSRTTKQLADLNGDGIPDLLHKRGDQQVIHVQFGTGSGFGSPRQWPVADCQVAECQSWPVPLTHEFESTFQILLGTPNLEPGLVTGPDVLAGTGSIEGVTVSGSLEVPIIPDVLSVGGSASIGRDTDTYELALLDMDGDGAADHVLRRQVGRRAALYVKHNRVTGKANLLSKVHRPLGGSIALDYERTLHTVDMPHSRKVLTKVEVAPGFEAGPAFANPTLVTQIEYAGGFYDRHEKEFFGFAKVTATRADGVNVATTYLNGPTDPPESCPNEPIDPSGYVLHGRVRTEERRDVDGKLFQRRELCYGSEPVRGGDGTPIPLDPMCFAHKHPLLPDVGCAPGFVFVDQEVQTRAEGGTLVKTRTMKDASRDRFGNVLVSTDSGDDAIANDDVFAQAGYRNDEARWVLGRATSLEVHAVDSGGALLRARTGDYNALGDLIAAHVDTGTGTATTLLGYDAFGNLTQITSPPNESGKTQTFEVTFDSTCATYPVRTQYGKIEEGFGYVSTADYDLRFGVATTEKDVNGAELHRTLDGFGRLVAIGGPYDSAASPGLVMVYHPEETPPRAITTTTPSAPPDYAGPMPPATVAVSFIDGLGRTLQVGKTAVVDGAQGMVTTGLAMRDNVGRVLRSYQPVFRDGASTGFVVPATAPLSNAMTYDALDRQVSLIYPDGASEAMTFDLAVAPSGGLSFLSRAIDPNGHARETYADHLGRTRAFVEHPDTSNPGASSVSSYDYLATGELSRITDAEGNVSTLTYDRRGLRTALANPDTGLIEETYDLMGNRVALVEPNHRALDIRVRYRFDRDRLVGIDYPSKPDVTFTYGAPNAPFNRAGRLFQIDDETGSQVHEFGALGELRRTKRTVFPSNNASNTVFDLHLTSDSLGRQLRIGYPDGEVVTNEFDQAGMLARVAATGTGWSRVYAQDMRYDRFGHRTQIRLGNGTLTRMTYQDDRVRLATLRTELPSSAIPVQNLAYAYDAASNPTSITNTLPALSGQSGNRPGSSTLTLTYDGVDRLVTSIGHAQLNASKTTDYDQRFAYSASHNLTHKQRAHSISTPSGVPAFPNATNFSSDYTYAAARPHLPTQIGSLLVTYDPSGNPLTRTQQGTSAVQTLVWDDDNRLVDFTGNGVHQHNTFDAGGNRVRRKSTQSETVFSSQYFDLENGTQGVKHVFAGPTRVASELTKFTSGENPIAPAKPGVAYFFHVDHLGSTSVLTDESGAVYQSLEYFSDGEMWIDRAPSKPVNGYLFNGKPFDPDTGFYDFGQRFYDPRTSLWLGPDSAFQDKPGLAVTTPSILASNVYAANSPVALIDPDGRCVPCGIIIFVLVTTEGEAGENAEPSPTTGEIAVNAMMAGFVAGRWAKGAAVLASSQASDEGSALAAAIGTLKTVGPGRSPRAGGSGTKDLTPKAEPGEVDFKPGGAVGQIGPETCGAACGEMVTGIPQKTIIKKLGTSGAVGPEALGNAIGRSGGTLMASSASQGLRYLLAKGQSWIAMVKGKTVGHFVVIEGRDSQGLIVVRDPRQGGVTYKLTEEDFLRRWDHQRGVFQE
jgi:RHS repeat-associated protein